MQIKPMTLSSSHVRKSHLALSILKSIVYDVQHSYAHVPSLTSPVSTAQHVCLQKPGKHPVSAQSDSIPDDEDSKKKPLLIILLPEIK